MKKEILNVPVIALRDLVIMPDVTMHFNIGRKTSLYAMQQGMQQEQKLIVVAQKDSSVDEPVAEDLFTTGTYVEIKQVMKMQGNIERIVVAGVSRAFLKKVWSDENCIWANADIEEEEGDPVSQYTFEEIAMVRGLKDLFQVYVAESKKGSGAVLDEVMRSTNLEKMIDYITACIEVNYVFKQQILDEEDVTSRHEKLSLLLTREIEILRIQNQISAQVQSQVEKGQKDYYLREQMKVIRKELGEEDIVSEAEKYETEVEKLKAPKKVKKKIQEEIRRLKQTGNGSSENAVIRGYIETLLKMPWKKMSKDNLDIVHAQEQLDKDHYGMKKIKERIVESLAVKKLTEDGKSPILCLVGPPGTGKTSIARSIAAAMNRKYVRICLGGVRDEAELRGHRRTYVGAMPGRIAMALKQVGVKNPVMLLDEIDKLDSDYKGDPSAALLEILDPEQNKHFSDHYVELPLDLSKVLFLCTANEAEAIPRPLYDRMEIIEVSGYTQTEKFHIAKEHLLEKQMKDNGLCKSQISISDTVLQQIISDYTREAGVRELQRQIGAICRKAACQIAKGEQEKVRVSKRNLEDFLGKKKYLQDQVSKKAQVGIVQGLAWTQSGGVTLEVEVNIFPGTGQIILTGQLGDVMKESAEIALSFVRYKVGKQKEEDFFQKNDVHIHIPEGAVPKDGPSAGVTMATAIYSAVMEKKVRPDIAMTGEITLRGRVLPIGGLKEKLLAAKMVGITLVAVPEDNRSDYGEIDSEIKEGMNVFFVQQVEDIWKRVWETESESIKNK